MITRLQRWAHHRIWGHKQTTPAKRNKPTIICQCGATWKERHG